jgi:hypothetical protein
MKKSLTFPGHVQRHMKKRIWILLVAFISFCCNQKEKIRIGHNDLFFDNLKGNIEKVEESAYILDPTGKVISPDSCCKSIIEYDNRGYRIINSNVDIDGHEKNRQNYTSRFSNGMVKEITFTENGKLTSILSGTLNKKGSYGDTQIYDSSGKLVSYYTDIITNEFNKIISMKNFKPDSTLRQVIVNNYSKNIWIGGFIKDSSGKEIISTLIELNEKSDPIEQVQIMLNNGLPNTTTTRYAYNTYDDHDNWIQRTEMDEKRNVRKLIKRQIKYKQ